MTVQRARRGGQAMGAKTAAEFVTQAFAQGAKSDKIVDHLVAGGWNRVAAMKFVQRIGGEVVQMLKSPDERAKLLDRGVRSMIYGTLWLLGGGAITLATYLVAVARPEGGYYIIAHGPVFFGAIAFCRGLAKYISSRSIKSRLDVGPPRTP